MPGKLSGAWVFKKTRVPVEALFVNLASGATVDEFVDWFEGVPREQVVGVLQFLARKSRVVIRQSATAAEAVAA